MKAVIKKAIRKAVPLEVRQKIRNKEIDYKAMELRENQKKLQRLQNADYSSIKLQESTLQTISIVQDAAEKVYGHSWNFYSNALRPEVAEVFEKAIGQLSNSFERINYLEIGSCQGLSMSLIGKLISNGSCLGDLYSIDPYFEDGYIEGKNGIWKKDVQVDINKSTRDHAHELYKKLELKVEHIEALSIEGLKQLMKKNKSFELIYIDGSHEGMVPLRDLALSLEVLVPKGIVILDDHFWPDVNAVKSLCDRHFKKIGESWKVAAYEV